MASYSDVISHLDKKLEQILLSQANFSNTLHDIDARTSLLESKISSSPSPSPSSSLCPLKFDLPSFNGEDALGLVSMDAQQQSPNLVGSLPHSLGAAFCALQLSQTQSLQEYISEFESLANRISGLTSDARLLLSNLPICPKLIITALFEIFPTTPNSHPSPPPLNLPPEIVDNQLVLIPATIWIGRCLRIKIIPNNWYSYTGRAQFHLEDKVPLQEGGDVRPIIIDEEPQGPTQDQENIERGELPKRIRRKPTHLNDYMTD
ncbi:hypothetical protein V8G54_024541 [Vigna mungo]|uniref:Uncharacterized protein n=1 Tax=Vigna mungo TaxID=3915 RepID=A0AAQ3N506_VIGMU